ncbi:MAG: polyprenyl synthetase family protein [Ferrimicrobium sp.]
MNDESLLNDSWVPNFLDLLEGELRVAVQTEDPLITEVATHLVAAGGKRIRPLLSFAIAQALAPEPNRSIVQGAAAVELVHLASLYHDDVMDEATQRRGVQSVNNRWGNLVAVVTGDFLLARAAGMAARLGSPIAELLADTLAAMCEGQILEVGTAYRIDRSVESYLSAIEGKTASLMATSARIPGILLELDPGTLDDLTALGHHLGMIFQLRDDLMDLFATTSDLKKLPGQDLSEGIFTLPVLLALQEPTTRPILEPLLHTGITEAERAEVARCILASPAPQRSINTLRSHEHAIANIIAGRPELDLGWIGRVGKRLVATAVSAIQPNQAADLRL